MGLGGPAGPVPGHFFGGVPGEAVRHRKPEAFFQIAFHRDPFAIVFHLAGPGTNGDDLAKVLESEDDGNDGNERNCRNGNKRQRESLVEDEPLLGLLLPTCQQFRLLLTHPVKEAAEPIHRVAALIGEGDGVFA